MRIVVRAFAALLLALAWAHAADAPVIFAAYNVQNWILMERNEKGRHEDSAPKPEESKAAVIDSIQSLKPDILGIEEMGDDSQFSDFQKRLAAAGLNYPYTEFVKASDQTRHVVLLSRFPITAHNSRTDISFKMNGRLEYMPRGILDVTIQVNAEFALRVLGVHFKSRRDAIGYDQAMLRMHEARELRKYMDDILRADANTNLLVFGDFNDTKNEEPIKEIIGKRGSPYYMEDMLIADPQGDRWTYYWNWADEYSRIDYFFASRALRPEVLLKKSGIVQTPQWHIASDHRLIYIAILPHSRPHQYRE